jgi:hypothetical protein
MARKLADSARLAMGESGAPKSGRRFFEKKAASLEESGIFRDPSTSLKMPAHGLAKLSSVSSP